ncbi:MAG: hypothetical protein OK422_01535 [Thaumarchaeota archaeon]|nr:hypothetical protein [Nitrososphaerota archaeon]
MAQRAGNLGILGRVASYLRSHPVILLLLLSPGIPEYLSSSSPLNAIILNPGGFLFQIAANLGLYGPGVLLIREAMVRWKKGWASVLLLGAAYGILEEGIALSTLFYSGAGPVGQLGTFGHWLGVSWVWAAGVVPVHMVLSISLPILLLGLAVPTTQGRSLLSGRRTIAAFMILGLDVTLLLLFVVFAEHFWMGWPIFAGAFILIGALVYISRRLPSDVLTASTDLPRRGPRAMTMVGILFFPGLLFSQFIGMGVGLPPAIVFGLVILVQGLLLFYVLKKIGRSRNERTKVGFAIGILLPISVFGFLAEIQLPVVLLVDFGFILFFRGLWRTYRPPFITTDNSKLPSNPVSLPFSENPPAKITQRES